MEAYEATKVPCPDLGKPEESGSETSGRYIRARKEYKGCHLSYETGELECTHIAKGPPKEDCRLWPYCPHSGVMVSRLRERLRQKYAPPRKR